eukprot:06183_6
MGTSLMVSTPPAMTASAPVRMSSVAFVMATFEEMHARVTVLAGTRSEIPAPKAASRAMLEVLTSWITVPIKTRWTASGLIPVRLTRPIAWRARSAIRSADEPEVRNGVRTASTTTTFLRLGRWAIGQRSVSSSEGIWLRVSRLCLRSFLGSLIRCLLILS